MTKNNIKRRHNKTLDLSSVKRYRPLSRNTFDAGGITVPGLAGSFGSDGPSGLQKMNIMSSNAAKDAFSSVGNGLSSAGSIIGGVTGIVDSALKNAQIADTTGIESSIADTQNTDFSNASDTTSLLDSWNSVNWQDADYTMKDVRGVSTGEMIGNTISAVGQGAMAGAQVGGPWGAVAGAAVGLGGSLVGIFSGNAKARKKAAELNERANIANQAAINNFDYTAENLEKQQYKDMLANVTKDGGKIHIKPSKRGTFTAAAKRHGKSVQAFASQVLANKENYSPAMVKKANFARNASKWKHSLGGFLYGEGGNLYSNVPDSQTHGTDFSNGMTLVNKGGTHEQNPLDGVQMGVDTQGVPNLVEEGEVIFNDYVFSNRLYPSEKELEKANLPKRYKGHTFALIAEDMGKESSERPNDPISRRGLEDLMMKLAMVQEAQRARKGKKGTQQLMAYGGRKYDSETSFPWTGAMMDDGNFVFNNPYNYTFTNRRPSWGYHVPRISPIVDIAPYSTLLSRIQSDNQERTGIKSALPQSLRDQASSIMEDIKNLDTNSTPAETASASSASTPSLPTWMRYAPVVGSAVGAIQSIFQKPDYENADILMQEARDLSRPSVRYRALNNYLTYRPLDRNYYLNQLKGQAGATRRGIMNSGSNAGNVMAGLLAADYNAQNAVGNTLMKMEEYNDAQRQKVAEFNRGTDQYNSQAAMSADAQNAQLAQNRDRLRSSLMTQAAQMREATDTALEATRSANLTNFFDNMGGIGQENFIMNQIASNPSLYYQYTAPGKGTVGFKGRNGGMLTKKNRRRK